MVGGDVAETPRTRTFGIDLKSDDEWWAYGESNRPSKWLACGESNPSYDENKQVFLYMDI